MGCLHRETLVERTVEATGSSPWRSNSLAHRCALNFRSPREFCKNRASRRLDTTRALYDSITTKSCNQLLGNGQGDGGRYAILESGLGGLQSPSSRELPVSSQDQNPPGWATPMWAPLIGRKNLLLSTESVARFGHILLVPHRHLWTIQYDLLFEEKWVHIWFIAIAA